jgi:hypothetical protein
MPDLATLASVKTYLGIATLDTSQDALLSALITAVSQEFLNEIGRPLDFAAAAYTERFCVWSTCKIFLKHYPVNSITSVTLDGVAVPVWDPNNPGTTGYVFDAADAPENKTSIIIRASCWPTNVYSWRPDWRWSWTQNAVVVYNGGYTTVPEAVAQAIREWVAMKRGVSQIQSVTQTNQSVTLGDYQQGAGSSSSSASSSASYSMPANIQTVIDQYTRTQVV